MTLLICDDHEVFADAMEALLERAGHRVVARTAQPESATEIVERESVDVCLLDLGFPGLSSGEVLDSVEALQTRTRVVALTGCPDPARLRQVLAAGARGAALKSDDRSEILSVISTVCRVPLDRDCARPPVLSTSVVRLLRGPPRQVEHELGRFLTAREREALTRLAQGESTTTLARSMGVRVSTARTHIDAVLTKLGAHSRLEAITYAIREGLVDMAGPDRDSGFLSDSCRPGLRR